MFVYKCQLDYKKAKSGSFSQGKGITFKTYALNLHVGCLAQAQSKVGEGSGGKPPSPFRPETCLRLKFLHRQARISLFNWLNFLNETAYRILPLN